MKNRRIQYVHSAAVVVFSFSFWARCQYLFVLFCEIQNDTLWMVDFRLSGFNVEQNPAFAHSLAFALFISFGCCISLTSSTRFSAICSTLSFAVFNFIKFFCCCCGVVFVSYIRVVRLYLCHFHYFIILYPFFSVLTNINAKTTLDGFVCIRSRTMPLAFIFEHTVVSNNNGDIPKLAVHTVHWI